MTLKRKTIKPKRTTKNDKRKEISMQNDEHGPVDSSRLCFVGYFSVIPCFRSLLLISLHRSPFQLSSLLLSASVSVSLFPLPTSTPLLLCSPSTFQLSAIAVPATFRPGQAPRPPLHSPAPRPPAWAAVPAPALSVCASHGCQSRSRCKTRSLASPPQ